MRSMLDVALGPKDQEQVLEDGRPTNYYFAYGSNLHLRQMKRRCPKSKYIGRARLSGYRWMINERGYANVVESKGHYVDGLVYEIDESDEGRLDVNEGVSKNAYSKDYLTVTLHRANTLLYRRPVTWIVESGGPAKLKRQAAVNETKVIESDEPWDQLVLVYISYDCITDSTPKEEYISRINYGIIDAKALGIEESYVQQYVRPFIPPADDKSSSSSGTEKTRKPSRRSKKTPLQRTGEHSFPENGKSSMSQLSQQAEQQASVTTTNSPPDVSEKTAHTDVDANVPPPLPQRPLV